MKQRTKLVCVALLCLAAVFCAGAAIRGFQTPETGRASYDGAEPAYVLREYDGYVSVYAAQDAQRPLQVTNITVNTLRRHDRDLLQSGLTVGSREQLLLLLEDLGA